MDETQRWKPSVVDPSSRDETSAEFEERFSAMTSSAYTVLGVALGSRLGLFHKMALMEEPWTPRELAEAGNWKERYIQEWLGAMVCSSIVKVVPSAEGDRYFLPQHRRELLMGPTTLLCQCVPILTAVYEDIVACFSKCGPNGVPHDRYPHFHQWCDDWNTVIRDWDCIQQFNKITPGLTEKLESSGRFLGIGCSTGVVECIYATKFPQSKFIGIDISEDAIRQAKDKAKSQGLKNVEFCVYDVYKMPEDWTETFDGIIGFDVLHDFPHPDKAVKELRRVLKVGGILVFRDIFSHGRIADNISIQGSAMMYAVSLFECMPLSLHSGGIGAGAMWGREKIIDCLKSAGFDDVLEPEPGCAQYVCVKK